LASVVAVTAGLALPTGAQATVSCSFNTVSGALTVDVTAPGPDGPAVSLQRNGSDIEVFDGFVDDTPPLPPVSCTNGPPTVTTTSSIQMTDTVPGQETDFNLELGAGRFEPGTGGPAEGGGIAEIEITIDGGDNATFGDEVTVLGSTGDDEWHFGALAAGANGGNLNAPEAGGPDGDDVKMTGIESLQVFTDPVLGVLGGNDHLIANGGTEFTGPFPLLAQISGGVGNDVLVAGTGNTFLGGDVGNDTMIGGPGDDQFRLAGGDDVALGGDGTDDCSYLNQPGDVTADLRITTQQNTGAGGLDTLSGCENLQGGEGDDHLTGTNGANMLDGGCCTGDSGADTLVGLGGNDLLNGEGGADALNIRDGGHDTASCGDPTPGPPADFVIADLPGVDTIDADCEQVLFAAAPPIAMPAPDTAAPETTIVKGPKHKTRKRKATIEFSSSEAGSTFECSLDGKPFAPCTSPFAKKVKRRRHSFQVRAIDQAGNADPSPALHKWRVKA
jgi:Ca2+-binding RTX toxin-like protein